MIGWLLAAVLACVSLTVTWFALIPTGLVLYWKVGRHLYLGGSKWRRVHFPFMRQYAHAAGFVTGLARQTGEDFDARKAILKTLQTMYPQTPDHLLKEFLESRIESGRLFPLRADFAEYVRAQNPRIAEAQLLSGLDRMVEKFRNPDNSAMVQLVVLGLIEREHGTRTGLDYLWAMAKGKTH
jgi:hypothetical protein